MSIEKNCVDLVIPFVDTLEASRIANVQLFGGIGSAALGNAKTVIVPDEKRVIAPADLFVPQHRADGNLRDLDCLVKSAFDPETRKVKAIAKSTIGKDLKISVFGIRPMKQLEWQRRHPHLAFAKVHVSDRYAEENDQGDIVRAKKALFPYEVDLPIETLETWQLQLGNRGDRYFPIPHPGATILNYLGRSISGTRPKDIAKVHALTKNTLTQWPELTDWIISGPGASQLRLARILHTIREPRKGARPLLVGGIIPVEPYSFDDLAQDEAFMLPERTVGQHVISAAHVEAATLFAVEKRPRVVTAWQKHIEPHIDFILQNK